MSEPDDERFELDVGGGEEARILRGRQEEQALRKLGQSSELVEDDIGIRGDLSVHTRVADQLGVATGDRDWRPQLVGGVANEKIREAMLPGAYGTPCHLCGRAMVPGQLLDLDHDVTGESYRGMTHRGCNRRDGAVRGNRMRRRRTSLIFPRWKENK